MSVDLIVVGKTASAEIAALVETYARRIGRRVKFSVVVVPDDKRLAAQFQPSDHVVLLDDKGPEYTSLEFAGWLERRLAGGGRRLCFVIGGPYGFPKGVYARADELLSLSRMTFSHQIIRAIFAEQLSRAFPILHNEPYHHE